MATRAPLKILTPPKPAATNSVAEADIREAKPPIEIPSGWAWLIALLTLAVLAAAAWWGWKKWKRRQALQAQTPPVPPHVRARERLQAALQLLSQPEPFCVAVSTAVRAYLEERFDLHAPERTTEEFLAELQSNDLLDGEQKRRLGEFLARCDLVKFARYEPTEVELLELHAAALRLVDETEPRLHPPPGVLPPPTSGGAPAALGGPASEAT